MLNRVVFPEPFGPMSPAMLPGSISIEQSSRACTPPKAFETPSVRSNVMINLPAAPFRAVRVPSAGSAGRPGLLLRDDRLGRCPRAGQDLHEVRDRLPLEDEAERLGVLAARLV